MSVRAQGSRRIALWVPDWPTNSLVVDCPPGSPAAAVRRDRVVAATAPARRRGVRVGMRRSTAHYLCPELVVVAANPLREAAAFEPIAQAFDSLAAGVQCLRPGLAWAPAAGPARWVGSEEALCAALVERVAESTGAECQVGVATGTLATLQAAHEGGIVSPQDTLRALAPLTLERIPRLLPRGATGDLGPCIDVLADLGVRTCADVRTLGRGALATRFGSDGEALWELAAGGDVATHGMHRRRESVEERLDVEPPAHDVDDMVLSLRPLARRLADSLERVGAASSTLDVRMRTEDGATHERTWGMVDCSDAAQVVERVRWQVRGWLAGEGRPGAALVEVGLRARELRDAPPARALWGASRTDARAVRAALRVQSLVGEEGVLAPHAQGGHDPRARIEQTPFGSPAPDLAPQEGEWLGGVAPDQSPATIYADPLPARLLGAAAVRVTPRGALSERPRWIVVARARFDLPLRAGVPCEVRRWRGPWAVLGRWWEGPDSPRFSRAFLRVEVARGQDVLLVERLGRWWVEGCYA